MRVDRYTDLAAFAERVEPYLIAHEAEHCLPLGLLSTRHNNPDWLDPDWYMACVENDAGKVALVALQTPPNNLILSRPLAGVDVDAAARALASDARDACGLLPGVIAPPSTGDAFARAWAAITGDTHHVGTRERIYRLSAVREVGAVSGAMRKAVMTDRDALKDWMRAFMREALGQDAPVDDMVDRRLVPSSPSGMYIWEDGRSVSAAGYGSPTLHGVRIGPVYTPPESRGRGYASALVAQMSQRLLDEGRQYCFLFTDRANATANHIYQEIGYVQVAEAAEIQFDCPGNAR